MFWGKKKVHRDDAASIFMKHCATEAKNLEHSICQLVFEYCDGMDGRPPRTVLDRPFIAFRNGRFIEAQKLISAHCYAIALSVGLAATEKIDPHNQASVMVGSVHRLLVKEDVGVDAVGHAPNPSPHPGMHISVRAGTFVGGVPSQQQKLVRRYEKSQSSIETAAMLFLALGLIDVNAAVVVNLYEEDHFDDGVIRRVVRRQIGHRLADFDDVYAWKDDLRIVDARAALRSVPPSIIEYVVHAIDAVDPFWPSFCTKNRLTY